MLSFVKVNKKERKEINGAFLGTVKERKKKDKKLMAFFLVQ